MRVGAYAPVRVADPLAYKGYPVGGLSCEQMFGSSSARSPPLLDPASTGLNPFRQIANRSTDKSRVRAGVVARGTHGTQSSMRTHTGVVTVGIRLMQRLIAP